jgi:hypothetical protein
MDDEVDVDDEKSTLTMKRLMNSPRTSSPEQPLGHVVCKPSIYKTAFIFRRVKLRGRH